MTKSKKMKKWQKIAIVILLVFVALFAGLKAFKRQVLSVVLNDKELAVYDCCCKVKRVAKENGVKVSSLKCVYATESENSNMIWMYVYSYNSKSLIGCNAEYNIDNNSEITWFGITISEQNVDYEHDTLKEEITDLSTIDYEKDFFSLNNESHIQSEGFLPIRYVYYVDSEDDFNKHLTTINEGIADGELKDYSEIKGFKSLLISLYDN